MPSNASTTAELKDKLPATQQRPALTAADMKKPQDLATLRHLFDSQKTEIARALPKHLDADRLSRIAFTTVRQTPALARCTPESLLGALMTCAQLGLEPGPLGHAWFVPFKNEVTFILGYKGMIELALRSGKIVSLVAREVHQNDTFHVAYGLDDKLEHEPMLTGDRGPVIAYYAVAKLVGGGHVFIVLSRPDVEEIRKRSRARDSGPWQSDYNAMAKKTCVRRLFTYLPTSVELAQALAQDGQPRTDFGKDALDDTPTYDAASTPEDIVDGEVVPDGVDPATGEITDADVVDPDEPDWPAPAEVPA